MHRTNRLNVLIFGTLAVLLFTGGTAMAFTLESNAFTSGNPLPSRNTCDGADLSPPLAWSGAPATTKTFALIVDDPDAPAGTWVHWMLWNIPATVTSLREGLEKSKQLADGTRQGITDFRRPGYGGPCPPSGTHRYFFRIFALDAPLDLAPTATRTELDSAMKGHVLAKAELMATYSRAR